ncbi:MAG TPA: adenylosuccinate synthase [Gaiellaceae bacterium]|nr:adenylosuccinate synthase [Gaiellaceae bacterium]HLF68294.1 adenylosuccinate synthase [Gaiellaceae bacterium]
MPAIVIVGAQWGDEGKGKIVDLLAQESDLVCRYQGGPNAGHTIVVGEETYRIRQIPSGIVAGKPSAIGAGCVVDPAVLIAELDELETRGHPTTGRVFVSGNAHLIMPWHVALDGARERRLGRLQIGTTRRGIGPAYADKATRIGIRVQDLLDPKILRQKLELAVAEKNVWLERVYDLEPFDVEDVVATHLAYAKRLGPYVADTSLLVDRALRSGEHVLFEGAQGTLLDLDHGTYPFVTSSSPIAAGAAVSFGIGPNRVDEVVGVAKAYVTRVGEGPFPSEIEGPAKERVRDLGREFGTVTGRQRRCGWLDLVALRFAVRVNGITSLALTKLDVLSEFAEIPVCVRYRLPDGAETDEFPAHQSDFHHCRPVFELLPGWEAQIGDELPAAARGYVAFVEEELGVDVTLVGTGAARERVLALR